MRHRSLLTFVLPVALLLVCAGSRQAAAQLGTGGTTGIFGTGGLTGTSGTGTTLASSDFFTGVQAVQNVNLSTFDAARFFDIARCQCATPVWLFIALLPSGFAKRSTAISGTGNTGQISVWLGPQGCDYAGNQALGICREIAHEPLLTFLNQGSWTIPTDARTMSTYLGTSTTIADGGTTTVTTGTAATCTAPTGSFGQNVWIVIDTNGDGTSDLTISDSINVDLLGPAAPTNVTVEGGNQALVVKWDQVDQATNTDLVGYQILCSRADKYQVFNETWVDGGGSNGPFSSGFETCPANQVVDTVDGGAIATDGVETLNPTFVCSGLLSPAATSFRVETLQNGIYYAAAVVSVDNSGNPSSPPQVLYGKPVRTLSFYDVYRDGYSDSTDTNTSDPGAATGGFCAVAARRTRWQSTGVALAGLGIVVTGVTLARRRRRRR
ncbi:MAG TPA: hypothetical protein VMT03_13045 [Polyangia bacterium]|nr:hypothetical protein [Polyangia bacterium]